ncbi:MAG: hypothetical protein MZW92_22120 [Comamonadaceae bacterium]|nr:hypothetical protein [Comamonadaceae bacterium]
MPPAIAIDQTNPVRTSRSTVGTMTELNDHLKLLFARAAQLFCRGCGAAGAARHAGDASTPSCSQRAPRRGRPAAGRDLPGRACPHNFSAERKSSSWLAAQRLHARAGRARATARKRARRGRRTACALRQRRAGARDRGASRPALRARRRAGVDVHRAGRRRRRRGATLALLHRPALRRTATSTTRDPHAERCSRFNSPIGACETCRGFGRVIGVDYGLVIPDDAQDAARRRDQAVADAGLQRVPGRPDAATPARRGIPRDTPWQRAHRRRSGDWVIEGDAALERQLEQAVVRRARASSSGWRARPTRCTSACCCPSTAATRPAQLRRRAAEAEALLWRIGTKAMPTRCCRRRSASCRGRGWSREQLEALPGLTCTT